MPRKLRLGSSKNGNKAKKYHHPVRKPKIVNKKFKKFLHIKRNQESEQAHRKQTELEVKFHADKKESDGSSTEEEPVNFFGKLIDSLNQIGTKNQAIDSGSSDESDDDEVMHVGRIESGGTVDENEENDERDQASDTEEIEIDEKNDDMTGDPFHRHFDYEIHPNLLDAMINRTNDTTIELNWPELGRLLVKIPIGVSSIQHDCDKKPKLLEDGVIYATEGQQPNRLMVTTDNLNKLFIKAPIQRHLVKANQSNLKSSDDQNTSLFTSLQVELFSVINNYQDLYWPHRTIHNCAEYRFVYCLHTLNHILKSRSQILRNTTKLNEELTGNDCDLFRDQGLFRPKVLIVVPFKNSALKIVDTIISLIFPEKGAKVMNYKRFVAEFGGDGLYFPKSHPKPEDYEQTLAGNVDDTFRIGMSLTKKCLKLYTDFYSSDIIVASPLGLRLIIGAAGESDRDYDFLSSIELLIIDQADVIVAQNWDHVIHFFDHLHLQPQAQRNTDYSRVRTWSLNGWSKFYRQTLFFTTHELPEFRSLFNGKCSNYRGHVRTVNSIRTGSIRNVAVQIPQTFYRIEVGSIDASYDRRFEYFCNKILPQYKSSLMAHCMVYVPSYFDFVRLRNYFKKETINFVQIGEYTKEGKMARARDMFFHSAAPIMLYSERGHFFRRNRIKGIRHLIMYQPPTWPNFYPEIINFMQEANQNTRDGSNMGTMTVTVLYTKYDLLQLGSIVGSKRAVEMVSSPKCLLMFMTNE